MHRSFVGFGLFAFVFGLSVAILVVVGFGRCLEPLVCVFNAYVCFSVCWLVGCGLRLLWVLLECLILGCVWIYRICFDLMV